MSILTSSIQCPCLAIMQKKKRNERNFKWKHTDDMILNKGKSKDSIRKILELIREFGKVAGYKSNKHKSTALGYANDCMIEKELIGLILLKRAKKNQNTLELT